MAAKGGKKRDFGRNLKSEQQRPARYFDRVTDKSEIHESIKPSESNEDRLEQSTLDYFNEVSKVLEANEFQNEEDKELFITNVLKSVKGEESKLALNKKTSKVLETFLGVCSEREVLLYAKSIEGSLPSFCTHHCASHVVQTLLETCLRLISKRNEVRIEGGRGGEGPTVEQFVNTIVEVVCSDLDALIVNEHGSHVICFVVEVLSGHKLDSFVRQSKRSHRSVAKVSDDANGDGVSVPAEFIARLRTLAKTVVQLDDFDRLSKIPCSSVVLQFVLLALHKVDEKLCKKVVATILASMFTKKGTNDEVLEQLKDHTCAHLVEVVIKVSTSKSYAKLFKKYFKGNLKAFALDRTANFVLQRLIKTCPDKLLFEQIYDELENSWEEIGAAGHMGVLTSLSESCIRLIACQANFVKNLSKMLNCDDFSEKKFLIVPLVASLSTYDEWKEMSGVDSKWEVNYHGSVLIQNILKFHKPFRVVESLIKMSPSDLLKLLCNPFGSYIMDAIMTSKTVSGVSKTNFLTRLKGSLVDLACDKHGSRCLDTLFKGVDIKGKFFIAEILVENINKLRSDPIGTFATRTFGLDQFKRNSNTWKDWQSKDVKKRELFGDILSQSNKKLRK